MQVPDNTQTYFRFLGISASDAGMRPLDKLHAIMKSRNINQGELADLLDVSQPTVSRWLFKDADPRGRHRDAINQLYERTLGEGGVARTVVGVHGYVGAGAEIMPDFEQVPPEGLEQVTVEFALPEGMIAFRVRGSSMLPQFHDGATIIVYRDQPRPLDQYYGREAIVRTADGRRFLKTIMRGAEGVTLTSWNAAPIENQKLEWIGEIYATLPPSFSVRRG